MSTRIWREWQHPRDERGRFARKGAHSRKWMERAFESFKRDRPEATPETFRLHLTPRDTAVTRAAAAAIAGKQGPQTLQQIGAAIAVPRGAAAAKRVDEAAAKLRAIKGGGIDADIARRAAPKLDAIAEDLRAGRIDNTEASNRIGAARASIADPDAAGVLRRLDGELAPRPVVRPRPAEPAPATPPPPAAPAPAAPTDPASLVRGLGTLNNAPPSARDRYARRVASLQAITSGPAASTATDTQRAALARGLLDEQVRHGGTGGDEAAALRSLIERWEGPRATEPPARPRVVVEPPRRQEWGRAPQFNAPTAPITPVDTSRDTRNAGGMPPVSAPEPPAAPPKTYRAALLDALNGGAVVEPFTSQGRQKYRVVYPGGRKENATTDVRVLVKSGDLVSDGRGSYVTKDRAAVWAAARAEREAAARAEREAKAAAAPPRQLTPEEIKRRETNQKIKEAREKFSNRGKAYLDTVRERYAGKSRPWLLKTAKSEGVDIPRGASEQDIVEALTRARIESTNIESAPNRLGASHPLVVAEIRSMVGKQLAEAAKDTNYLAGLGRFAGRYEPGMSARQAGTVHPEVVTAVHNIIRREGLNLMEKEGQARAAELLGFPQIPADAPTEKIHANELTFGDLTTLGSGSGLGNRVASVVDNGDGTVTVHTIGITGRAITVPGNTETRAKLAERVSLGAQSQDSRRALRELEDLHQERIRNAYARMDTAPPIYQAPADGRRPVSDVLDMDRSPHHSEWKGSRTPDAPPGHRNMVLSDPGMYDGIAARAEIYNPAGPGQPYKARIWDYEDGRTLAEFQSNDLKEVFTWADQVHDTRRGKAMPRRPGVTAEYFVKQVKAAKGAVSTRSTYDVRERLSTGEERLFSGHIDESRALEEAAKANRLERARLGIPEPEPPKPPAPAPVKPRTNRAPVKVAPVPKKPRPAKVQRGDLVAVMTTRTTARQGAKSTTEDVVKVYRVASVGRDGKVSRILPIDAGPDAKPFAIDRFGQPVSTRVINQTTVDIDSAVAAVQAHHWEGHPDQLKDFESYQELVDWMRPRVKLAEQRPATAGPVRTGSPRAEALGSITVTPDQLKPLAATWTEPRLKEAGYVQGLATVKPGDDAVIYSRGDLRQGIVTKVTPRRVEVTYTTASAIRDQERLGGDLSVTAKLDNRDRVWIRDSNAVTEAAMPAAPVPTSSSRADSPRAPLTREQLVTRGEMMRQADRAPHIEALRQAARDAGGDRTKEEITADATRAGDAARAEVADLPYVGSDQFATAYADATKEAAAQRLRRTDNAATRRVLESVVDDPKADPARRAVAAWVLNRFDKSGREEKMAADDARRREADFRSDASTLAEMSATAQGAQKYGVGVPEADAAVAEFDAKLAGLVDRHGAPVDLARQGFGVDEARRLVRAAALRRAEMLATRQAHQDIVDRRQAMKTPEGRRAAEDAVKRSAMHLENVEMRVPTAERAAEDANRAIDAEVAKLRTQRAEELARPVTISPQRRAEMTANAFNEATRGEGVPSPHSQEAQAEIRRARKAAGLPSQAAIKKMPPGEQKFAVRATAMVDRTVRNQYGVTLLAAKVEAGRGFLQTADIEDPRLRVALTRQVDDWAAANDTADAIIKRGERNRDVALAALQAIGDGPAGPKGDASSDMLRGLESNGEDSEAELVRSMALQVGADAAGRFADRIRALGPVPESDLAQPEQLMPAVRRELDRIRKPDAEIAAEVVNRRGGYRIPTDAEISGMTGVQKVLATEAAAAVTAMVHKIAEHDAAGRESGAYESAARNPLASRAARDRFEALYQRAHERAMQLQGEKFDAERTASVKANAYHAVAAGDVGEPGAATDLMLRDLGPRARAAVEQLARTVGAAAAMRLANDLRASGSWVKAY